MAATENPFHRKVLLNDGYVGTVSNSLRHQFPKPWAPYVPTLKDMCIEVLARNFESSPNFGKFDQKTVKSITDLLPVDLPLELAGRLISDEDYWERKVRLKWRNAELRQHGGSFKQCFFERTVTQALESFDPETSSLEELRRLIAYSAPFVRSIAVSQLPSHLELSQLLKYCLSDLTHLRLSYGALHCGMDYERSLFGMTLQDVQGLAAQLPLVETLCALDLTNSVLDDEKVRALQKGLAENRSITSLSLAHNRLADRAARVISKLLDTRSVLMHLDLSNNMIHTEGGKALARALRGRSHLLSLNLRLNQLGEAGGRMLLDALCGNQHLQRLNVSANGLGITSGVALAGLVHSNRVLLEIDCSANPLGEDAGAMVKEALAGNKVLRKLDVRRCEMGDEAEEEIGEMARANVEAANGAMGKAGAVTDRRAFMVSKMAYGQ